MVVVAWAASPGSPTGVRSASRARWRSIWNMWRSRRRRIRLTGHYRREGEGNTIATVIAVGVFAGFVTGKSGSNPAGRELVAHTKEDLPVAFAGRCR